MTHIRTSLAAALVAVLAVLSPLAGPAIAQSAERSDPEARRAGILAIARAYAEHEWTATEKNVFHGVDPNGVRVDTPDAGFREGGWKADGTTNVGIPYQWGGFSTIEEFDRGVAAGRYAGHLPLSGAARPSAHAVGVDCSGFVSRCWDLPTKQSTRSLGKFCFRLDRLDDLLPGDAVNSFDGHVVLFERFEDEARTRIVGYEAGIPDVKRSVYEVSFLEERGYVPIRYKPLDPRWETPVRAEPSFDAADGIADGRWIPGPGGERDASADLPSPLAQAVVGAWCRYEVTAPPETLPFEVRTVTLLRRDGGRLDLHSESRIQGKPVENLESLDAGSSFVESLVDFASYDEKPKSLEVESIASEDGRYELAGREFPARRTRIDIAGTLVIRSIEYPFRVEIDAIRSDEVPLFGLLRAEFRTELDFVGTKHRSVRTFALAAFGGDREGEETAASSAPLETRFRENEYRAHLRFLADDLCEGRAPGTRGGDLAALYIATRFEEAGLRPISKERGYFQDVPMTGNRTDHETVEFTLRADARSVSLAPIEEVVVNSERPGERVDLSGELVFVGYGIEAPELGWDDYKGTDVEGAILVMLLNDPDHDKTGFGSESLTYYGRWTYKEEIAREKGAAGLVLLHTDESATYGFQVVRTSNVVERVALDGGIEHPLALRAWVSRPSFDKALEGVGLDYDALQARADDPQFRPFPLGIDLQASFRQTYRRFSSPNVVGILPGGDLADEAILFMAHYDHLGIGHEVDGDRIYNGAVDNASGTAALLCLARAFAEDPDPPRRSIVFLATTAEEKGLLGSEYYAAHPAFPLDRTVLALNKDCCSFQGRRDGYSAFPVRHTDAIPVFEALGRDMGLAFSVGGPDRGGGAFRTDSFPLSARGVVGLSIGLSGKNLTLTEEEVKAIREKAGRWYHQPTDEIREDFVYDGVLQEMEILYRVGRHFAGGASAPQLVEGHPFAPAGKMRGR
jgi:hypothetical protein